MKCKQYEKYAYLMRPGELSAAEEEEWRAHRHQCPSCRSLYAAITAQQQAMTEWRGANAPGRPPATAEILRRIARHEKERPSRLLSPLAHPRWQWAQAAGVMALCALFVWQTWLTPAAHQESHLPPARRVSPALLDPGLEDLGFLARNRPCLAAVRDWSRRQGSGAGSPSRSMTSLQQRAEKQERSRELARLIESCGWQPEEIAFILRHRDAFVKILTHG
ncbi:MAG TPA: hypothetical protein PKI62_04900 [bacterium]|nr:hypothetical protein [bacterium]HPR87527.1 hypothetical protein [bacterium]